MYSLLISSANNIIKKIIAIHSYYWLAHNHTGLARLNDWNHWDMLRTVPNSEKTLNKFHFYPWAKKKKTDKINLGSMFYSIQYSQHIIISYICVSKY